MSNNHLEFPWAYRRLSSNRMCILGPIPPFSSPPYRYCIHQAPVLRTCSWASAGSATTLPVVCPCPWLQGPRHCTVLDLGQYFHICLDGDAFQNCRLVLLVAENRALLLLQNNNGILFIFYIGAYLIRKFQYFMRLTFHVWAIFNAIISWTN